MPPPIPGGCGRSGRGGARGSQPTSCSSETARTEARPCPQDGEIDGRPVRRGQQVVLVLGAGNRDPEQFADPDRLDVTRAEVRPLSFGHGIHFCLGAQLARLEATIAFEALVTPLPNLRLGEGLIRRGDNTVLRGPRAVPLRWGA
jgi:pimeloyl-[acyl-carrier protein] synthase